VILNTLTTMVGFAVLMIADHRGLQSLGRVLTIGMSCCLVSSLIILPAFLVWITRNRLEEEQEMPEPAIEEDVGENKENEAENTEEILRFPTTTLSEDQREWLRKRSA
jgi:hypothetical protein